MVSQQLSLTDVRSGECPFADLLDDNDNHCFSLGQHNGYEVISEDHPEFAQWLAEVRGVGFDDVRPSLIPNIELPNFIPTVTIGSKNLLKNNNLKFIAVSLRDIVSPQRLLIPDDIRERFSVGEDTKIILLNYAEDILIEKMWSKRKILFEKIASLNFDLVTAVNYSIWFDQPHAERLINMKRSLMTFEEMQSLGVPAVPHIYWTGQKDLQRWAKWLNKNQSVWCVAINLQTQRGRDLWDQTLADLRYLVSLLDRELHFIITGASKPERALQLKDLLQSLTITNGSCARKAASGYLIKKDNDKYTFEHSAAPKNQILDMNTKFYISLLGNSVGNSVPGI